eukprot:167036_1
MASNIWIWTMALLFNVMYIGAQKFDYQNYMKAMKQDYAGFEFLKKSMESTLEADAFKEFGKAKFEREAPDGYQALTGVGATAKYIIWTIGASASSVFTVNGETVTVVDETELPKFNTFGAKTYKAEGVTSAVLLEPYLDAVLKVRKKTFPTNTETVPVIAAGAIGYGGKLVKARGGGGAQSTKKSLIQIGLASDPITNDHRTADPALKTSNKEGDKEKFDKQLGQETAAELIQFLDTAAKAPTTQGVQNKMQATTLYIKPREEPQIII